MARRGTEEHDAVATAVRHMLREVDILREADPPQREVAQAVERHALRLLSTLPRGRAREITTNA
jgi:hypothetical protein